ncbi:HSP20-like chaperone [Amylostereum chailletii]|nr:HSP20-like chaperone [Amylostereum chailletii]
MSTLHPEVLWAQRSSEFDEDKNILFVTINLPDIIPDSLDYKLEPTKISFKARAGDSKKGIEEKDYAFSFDLFKEVVPEKSIQRLNSRSLALTLRKAEKELEYWPRLTKEKIRSQFLKTDFSKWVDEDEQDAAPVVEEEPDPMADLGMGGMPGICWLRWAEARTLAARVHRARAWKTTTIRIRTMKALPRWRMPRLPNRERVRCRLEIKCTMTGPSLLESNAM